MLKYILILLTTFILQEAAAQKESLQINAQGKTINASLQDEDTEKEITINSKLKSAATAKLSIYNTEWKKDTDWKRTFTIYNDQDQSILDLPKCKTAGKYAVSIKMILAKMKKGESYSLYTMAIPKDPKKAAVVRVRRVFVSRISVK